MIRQPEQVLRNSDDREAAIRDVERRTLGSITGRLSKLVYIASTRDFNTGQYHHAGLALQFGAEPAGEALRHWHWAIFEEFLSCSLRELIIEIELYASANHLLSAALLDLWQELEAYRILLPQDCDRLSRELFISEFKTGVAVLRERAAQAGHPPIA